MTKRFPYPAKEKGGAFDLARKKKLAPEEEVRQILWQAAPAATRLLVAMVEGTETVPAGRLDCAKEVLNRVLGRAGTPLGQREQTIQVVLQGEAEADSV